MNQSNNVDVSVVIPIYNEENILIKNVNQITDDLNKNHINYEIILVENGSTDRTGKLASLIAHRNRNIKLISMEKADYGMALKEGMLASLGKFIVNFDIDFFDIRFCLEALTLEPFGYDLIVASKNTKLSKDKRGRLRKLISGIYKYVLYYGFGLNVSDTHGIKAWRNDSILKDLIQKTINSKEIFDTELIIRSQYLNRNLLELPIEIKETRKSVSSVIPRIMRGSVQIAKLWVELKLLKK